MDIKSTKSTLRKTNDPVASAWAGELAAFILGKILEIALLFPRFFLRVRSRSHPADAPRLASFILRRVLIAQTIGLSCSAIISCSLVFDSDEYLAKKEIGDQDGGDAGGTGGTGGAGSGGKSGSGGIRDAAAGSDAKDAGDSRAQDAGTGGGGGESGTGEFKCDDDTDCGELLNSGWAHCFEGTCVDCDKDGDGWPSPDKRCDSEVGPFDLRDCDDNDNERYPHAPPICGDGKFNSCDVVLTPDAEAQFHVAEIGFLGLTILSRGRNPVGEFYPADFTSASQISIAGRQVGEVGVNSHLVAVITFVDSENGASSIVSPNTGSPNIGRLITIDVWEDGWPDVREMRQTDLNGFAQARDLRSVGIRRLEKNNSILAAMVGSDKSDNSLGSTLWYAPIESNGNDQYGPTGPRRFQIPQTQTCGGKQIDSTNTFFSRLAITGLAMDGLARSVWTQGAADSESRIIVSHLYANGSSTMAEAFNCRPLDSVPADVPFIELSGSSGPFVVGGSRGNDFCWEATASSPLTAFKTESTSRPALAFMTGFDHLVSVADLGSYWVANLVCSPGSAASCAVKNMRNIKLGPDTNLAAMDDLGGKAAVLGLVETSRPSGSSTPIDEVVIRILGPEGDVLPIGGVQFQPPPDDTGSEPETLVSSSLFPVFNGVPEDESQEGYRVVDLAVSAWLEEANTVSQYPLTILIAAIATSEPGDIAISSGQPEPGNLIVLGGIRGCREL
ncbi:MAG: hypothetical protein JXA30_21180 [Deltaproteobacteria bacterium]|nr:hypothetical protein [Deltaproteobacteria bacterium]